MSPGNWAKKNFYVPFGGHLREDNRWVRLATIIPWEEIEAEYKKYFQNELVEQPRQYGSP